MKKYALLNKDLSTLASEVESHLLAIGADSPAYTSHLYHPVATVEDLVESVPSLATAFDAESLTAKGIGHWCIDSAIRGIPAIVSFLIVPLQNTASCTFHIMDLTPTAQAYTDYVVDHKFYDGNDCISTESFAIENPIFVNKDTIFAIENTDSELAQFVIVGFNEDLSSFFTE